MGTSVSTPQRHAATELVLLYSADEIARRVDELAAIINGDYAGRDLLIIGVMKGSFVFLADLIRRLTLRVIVDFLGVSSYGLQDRSSFTIRLTKDLQVSPDGRHVLVVEDILETGFTADFVLRYLSEKHPASLRLCTLVDKREGRRVGVEADYIGFRLEKGFVVGYGIDYAEQYRNLPAIYLIDTGKR